MKADGKYILNENGDAVACSDLLKWGVWLGGTNRSTQRNTINGVLVSTIFLGLDHRFVNGGPPVLWETMIFGGISDGKQWRYTNKEAAIKNHELACRRIRKRFAKKHLHPKDQAVRSTWLNTH